MTDTDILLVSDSIKNMNMEQVLEKLDIYYNTWIKSDQKVSDDIFTILKMAIVNLGLNPKKINIEEFDRKRCTLLYEITYLKVHFDNMDKDLDDTFLNDCIRKFNKIFRSIRNTENSIRYCIYLYNSIKDIDDNIDSCDLFNYVEPDYTKNKSNQNLILFLLGKLWRLEYRRYYDSCYKKIRTTEEGYDTHAWKYVSTIEEFIYKIVDKNEYYDMFCHLTNSSGTAKWAAEYLSKCVGHEFMDINKDRHIFSFNNGIYVINKFSEDISEEVYGYSSGYTTMFIPYNSNASLNNDMVSSKYFNTNFDVDLIQTNDKDHRYNDYYNIILDKCPHFLSIMTHQEWPEDVQRWFLALIGRLCFEVGTLDDWQVMPFLLGQAGTGKSTVLTKVVKLFYEAKDIGTLGNNIEIKFGLGALKDVFLFIGPEIKGNFSMEQSEFQSIISGEDVQVAIKNKTATSIKWKAPGIIAGNEVPQFSDNAGSISRRLVVFLYNNKVPSGKGDTQLGRKLEKEIVYILHACVSAYLSKVNLHGSSDIWAVLPKYFIDSRDEMAENTNSLVHFLNSDKVVFDKDAYVTEKDFMDVFNYHCTEMNVRKPKWSKQYYIGPFATYNLKTVKDRRRYPTATSRIISATFIVGLSVVYKVEQKQGQEQE